VYGYVSLLLYICHCPQNTSLTLQQLADLALTWLDDPSQRKLLVDVMPEVAAARHAAGGFAVSVGIVAVAVAVAAAPLMSLQSLLLHILLLLPAAAAAAVTQGSLDMLRAFLPNEQETSCGWLKKTGHAFGYVSDSCWAAGAGHHLAMTFLAWNTKDCRRWLVFRLDTARCRSREDCLASHIFQSRFPSRPEQSVWRY